MRTTVTLDEDVAESLKAETARSGLSFKETINNVIRLGLLRRSAVAVTPGLHAGRELGLQPGIDFDNVEALLDQIEGPARP